MKKIILVFGLISGAISALMMAGTMRVADQIGFDKGEYLGYTVIVLSLLMVYFGIRSYRDNVGGGQVTFGRAFTVGLGITVISCICYVIAGEILYFYFMPDFMDKYGAYLIQKVQASGASAAAIAAEVQKVEKYKEMYNNPLINVAMTFMEPFPVGLGMTVISAAILRKKPQPLPAQSPVQAA
jgi:hypothetical protein